MTEQAPGVGRLAEVLAAHRLTQRAGGGWLAVCACGWKGDDHDAHVAAELHAAVLADGWVRPEDVAEAQARAWDEGHHEGWRFEARAENPYRAAALRPVDAPEVGGQGE